MMMKKILTFVYSVLGIEEKVQLGSAFLFCDRINEMISSSAGSNYMLNSVEYVLNDKNYGNLQYLGQQKIGYRHRQNTNFRKVNKELNFG